MTDKSKLIIKRGPGCPPGIKKAAPPFKAVDVNRAIRGALNIGIVPGRIDIDPTTGQISIVPGNVTVAPATPVAAKENA